MLLGAQGPSPDSPFRDEAVSFGACPPQPCSCSALLTVSHTPVADGDISFAKFYLFCCNCHLSFNLAM